MEINSLIESAAAGNKEDFRRLMQAFFGQFNLINGSQGLNWLTPTSGKQKSYSQAPPQATIKVSALNGLISVQITNPSQAVATRIFHEIGYSTVKNFSQNTTTLQPTTSTFALIPAAGQQVWVRLRSSYDLSTWNTYQLATTQVTDAGKQTSGAIENNVSLNQSNYAYVDSVTQGGTAAVRVYGVAGPYRAYQRVTGARLQKRPSGTIVGVPYSSDLFVGWDGAKFRVAPILTGIFPDNWEPVGKVSVISGAAFRLPTVSLVLGGGGAVLAWNVTDPGDGLVGPVTLVINTATGSGATAGAQTIENGQLVSIASGNPGTLYAGGDTVTVSGGTTPTTTGGGTAIGSNGGRLTAV